MKWTRLLARLQLLRCHGAPCDAEATALRLLEERIHPERVTVESGLIESLAVERRIHAEGRCPELELDAEAMQQEGEVNRPDALGAHLLAQSRLPWEGTSSSEPLSLRRVSSSS